MLLLRMLLLQMLLLQMLLLRGKRREDPRDQLFGIAFSDRPPTNYLA